MQECRFCQCDIPDDKQFKIVEPSGLETYFCEMCATDLVSYINSGKAERENYEVASTYEPVNFSMNNIASWPLSMMQV